MTIPMDSPSGADIAPRRWGTLLAGVAVVVAFIVTRIPHLDADVPDWALAQYSPIDEFGYTVPAFNLHHYGTWVHQAAPWAPVEGLPLNPAENIAAAISMRLIGYDYWGLRASSLAFGLIAFLALIAFVRRQGIEARRLDGVSARWALAVTLGAVALLLADFSSILSARIIEPTVTRLAVASVVLYLVGRGTFLGERRGPGWTGVFGVVVGAAVIFVYIYNLFLIPAALVTVAWWAYQAGGWAAVARHVAAFLVGITAIWAVYFVLVYGIYGQTPLEWYRYWLAPFGSSARASGLSVGKLVSVLGGNLFRMDPAFLALFLASLPVFAWGLVRRPSPAGVLIVAGLAFLVLQTGFVADYPVRKGLMMIMFAVPVSAAGVLLLGPFRTWLAADRRRIVAAAAWLALVVAVTLREARWPSVPPHASILVMIVQIAAVVGIVAIVASVVTQRRRIVLVAGVAFGLAVLAPLVYADSAFIFRSPTFTYRDALIQVRPDIDGQQTAGNLSFGMQLYNSSRAVLNGYAYDLSPAQYDRDLVRMFSEGLASSTFSYVDDATRTHLESLGFRLVDTYDILLPRGLILGRYVFAP